MARWETSEECYLHVEGTEWEYKEADPLSKKSVRKVFKVPMYIDKNMMVCDGNNCQRDDIIFDGPPVPSMTPLDDEAEAISAKLRDSWIHPIESLPTTMAGELVVPATFYDIPPPAPMARKPMRRG